MKIFNKIKGDIGEQLATNFLKKNKHKILERNYKNNIGEIDIIARQKKTIVFVEVKTRSSLQFGLPAEAVNFHKQHKIRQVAECYLQQHGQEDSDIRFDVIEVLRSDDVGQEWKVNHIEACF